MESTQIQKPSVLELESKENKEYDVFIFKYTEVIEHVICCGLSDAQIA